MKRALILALLAASSPAAAQHLEFTPLVSYTTPASIDQTAAGVDEMYVGRGISWGGQATYFVSDHLGLEVLWMYQSTSLLMSTASATADVFDMTTNQLHGNVVYQFGQTGASMRPFIFGGLGATFLDDPDLDGETKPSWTVGGGLKWFLHEHVGLKVQGRYKPTALRDASSDFCSPFGFCQGLLNHFEVAGGTVFRF
jgi:hypothetical protein